MPASRPRETVFRVLRNDMSFSSTKVRCTPLSGARFTSGVDGRSRWRSAGVSAGAKISARISAKPGVAGDAALHLVEDDGANDDDALDDHLPELRTRPS